MVKLLVGLLKGAAIGGAVGYGAHALEQSTGFSNAWLTVGVTLFVAASVRARARAAASVTNPELVHATPASAPRDEEQLTR